MSSLSADAEPSSRRASSSSFSSRNDGTTTSPSSSSTSCSSKVVVAPIQTALEVETLEMNLFRGTKLWKPVMARAVFGGQVIAQALMSCCKTVDVDAMVPHSLHAYFLLGGDSRIPIIYHVERVRDGASYVTRTCTALQKGKAIFSCMVSFHSIREAWSTEHAFPMPSNAPPPESLLDERQRLTKILEDPRLPEQYVPFITKQLEQESPIDLRFARMSDPLVPGPEDPKQLVWMKARGTIIDPPVVGGVGAGNTTSSTSTSTSVPSSSSSSSAAAGTEVLGAGGGTGDNASSSASQLQQKITPLLPSGAALALHQCVAAYASDFSLLGTALLPHGSPNPSVTMMASIDHSMWFHAPFRADEWLLYELESPRLVHGRGFALGRIFSRDGTLVASTAQEGVIRFRYDAQPERPLPLSKSGSGSGGRAGTAESPRKGIYEMDRSKDDNNNAEKGKAPLSISSLSLSSSSSTTPTSGSSSSLPVSSSATTAAAADTIIIEAAPSAPSALAAPSGQPLFTWGRSIFSNNNKNNKRKGTTVASAGNNNSNNKGERIGKQSNSTGREESNKDQNKVLTATITTNTITNHDTLPPPRGRMNARL